MMPAGCAPVSRGVLVGCNVGAGVAVFTGVGDGVLLGDGVLAGVGDGVLLGDGALSATA